MSTTATVITVAVASVVILRPDVVHHALNVVEKAIDAVSSTKQEDKEMSYGDRRGVSKHA